jgi:hypothetical protein
MATSESRAVAVVKSHGVRVVFQLPDGETRHSYATVVSTGGAFVLSPQPPQVGTALRVTLWFKDCAPLPPVPARIIGVRIDPASWRRTGFELAFTQIDDGMVSQIVAAISRLEPAPPEEPLPDRRSSERRYHPRVSTALEAKVLLGRESWTVQVVNVSISGALLDAGPEHVAEFAVGTELVLELPRATTAEIIRLRATVARITSDPARPCVGVHFLGLDKDALNRLECLILDELVRKVEQVSARVSKGT